MKICFIGAGALGSSIGSALSENNDVYLVDKWEEHISKINEQGLIVIENDKQNIIKINASTTIANLPKMDLIIILVKSFATREAIINIEQIMDENTLVMSLQNGVGNESVITSIIPERNVIGAKAYVGGVLIEAGKVAPGIKGKDIIIGELNGEKTPRIKKLAKELSDSGIDTKISNNIIGVIWDKLLVNVATGAVAGITGLTYGEMYKLVEIEEIALEAIKEAIKVAEAQNIKLTTKNPRDIWMKAKENLPYEFKTSILQSLEKNQITEIDFINGAIVKFGETFNIDTPVNKALTALIKGVEKYNQIKVVNSKLNHVAIYVRDINWHIDFFEKTMGFRLIAENNVSNRQVWLDGGIQLIQNDLKLCQGTLGHIAITVDNLEGVLGEIYKYNVEKMDRGENWIKLPEGLVLELLKGE